MSQYPPSDPPSPPPLVPTPPPVDPPPFPPGYSETPSRPSSLWLSPTPWAIVATFVIVLVVLSAVAGIQNPSNTAIVSKPSAAPIDSSEATSLPAVTLPPTSLPSTPTAAPTLTPAPTSPPVTLPTSLVFTSEPGDYIGQGLTEHFAPPNDTFTLFSEQGGDGTLATTSGFRVYVSAQDSETWSVVIDPPRGQTLHTGTYSVATRAAFRGGDAAGLDVYGDGRGCNMSFDSFTIIQLVANKAGVISAVDVSFTQHCEQATAPALTGRVAVKATV